VKKKVPQELFSSITKKPPMAFYRIPFLARLKYKAKYGQQLRTTIKPKNTQEVQKFRSRSANSTYLSWRLALGSRERIVN